MSALLRRLRSSCSGHVHKTSVFFGFIFKISLCGSNKHSRRLCFPSARGPDAEFGAPCRALGVSTAPSGAVTFSLLDVIPRRLTPALLCCYSRDLKSIWFIYKLSGQDLGKSFWLTSFSYDRMILQNRRYRRERHSLLSHSAVEKESRKITFHEAHYAPSRMPRSVALRGGSFPPSRCSAWLPRSPVTLSDGWASPLP